MLDNNQIKVLKEFSQKYGIQDSISHLSEHQIHLANGKTLDVDALICCTGSHVSNDAIPEIYIDHKPHAPDEFKHVYREHVLPEMPRIIFTSYIVMGAGVNGALNQAAWALNYMRLQPNEAYLKKESEYNEKPFLLNPMLFAKDEYMIKRVRAFWELLLRKDEVTMSALALVNWYFETVCSPFAARVVEFKKSSTE